MPIAPKILFDRLEELNILNEIVSINALLDKQGYKGRAIYLLPNSYCNIYVYKTVEEAAKAQKGLTEPILWSNCDAPAHAYFEHDIEKAD